MPQFKDTAGNAWSITLNIDITRKIKNALGVDLLKSMDDPKVLQRLGDDIETLVNTLWLCVSEQAATRSIDEGAFCKLLDGETIDQATRALLEALIDFFPESRRAILRKVADKVKAIEATILATIEEKIDAGAIEAALTPGKSSTD